MKFSLQNIEVDVFLGVPEEERENEQKILVSLSFEVQTGKAEKSDSLDDTVDYFEIYKFIKAFPKQRKFRLLERFARNLSEAIEKRFSTLKNCKLTVQKFPFEDASVWVEL